MKKILSLLAALTIVSLPAVSFAADPLSLKVEPGLAIPLTHPQSDRFHVGPDLMVKPLLGLTPWLDLGPSLSLMDLPSKVPGVDAGTAWGVGGGFRVKRPRDESNTDTGFRAVSPWLDADMQYARTGGFDRITTSVAVGAQFPTSDSRNLWIGPFVRYQDLVDYDSRVGYNTNDAHVLIVGLSFELGSSPVKPVVKPVEPCIIVCSNPRVRTETKIVYVPVMQPTEPQPVMNEVVYFAVDSAVIRPSELSPLADVIDQLKKHPSYNLRIEGHASSDGSDAHNLSLSQKRARAVMDYLVQHGIDSYRLSSVGFGEGRLAADEKTEVARQRNRRVEFEVKLVVEDGSSK